jgi:hypothetical protein
VCLYRVRRIRSCGEANVSHRPNANDESATLSRTGLDSHCCQKVLTDRFAVCLVGQPEAPPERVVAILPRLGGRKECPLAARAAKRARGGHCRARMLRDGSRLCRRCLGGEWETTHSSRDRCDRRGTRCQSSHDRKSGPGGLCVRPHSVDGKGRDHIEGWTSRTAKFS